MKVSRPTFSVRKKNRDSWEGLQAEIDELRNERAKLKTTQAKELINKRILELNKEQFKLGDIKC